MFCEVSFLIVILFIQLASTYRSKQILFPKLSRFYCASRLVETCENNVLTALVENNVPKDSTLLLGVSGGVDSVAMVHILQKLRSASDFDKLNLKIVHFNHKVRWESEEEVFFCVNFVSIFSCLSCTNRLFLFKL